MEAKSLTVIGFDHFGSKIADSSTFFTIVEAKSLTVLGFRPFWNQNRPRFCGGWRGARGAFPTPSRSPSCLVCAAVPRNRARQLQARFLRRRLARGEGGLPHTLALLSCLVFAAVPRSHSRDEIAQSATVALSGPDCEMADSRPECERRRWKCSERYCRSERSCPRDRRSAPRAAPRRPSS